MTNFPNNLSQAVWGRDDNKVVQLVKEVLPEDLTTKGILEKCLIPDVQALGQLGIKIW